MRYLCSILALAIFCSTACASGPLSSGGGGGISGTVTPAQGGTGTTTPPSSGQVPVGTSGNVYAPATILGTANRVTVTTGSGTITINGPQDLATSSSPQFSALGLGGAAGAADTLKFYGSTSGSSLIQAAPVTTTTVTYTLPAGASNAGDLWTTDSSGNILPRTLVPGSGITITRSGTTIKIDSTGGGGGGGSFTGGTITSGIAPNADNTLALGTTGANFSQVWTYQITADDDISIAPTTGSNILLNPTGAGFTQFGTFFTFQTGITPDSNNNLIAGPTDQQLQIGGSGDGNGVTVQGASATVTNHSGGNIQIQGGDGNGTGQGAPVNLQAGSGGAAGSGAEWSIFGGNAHGTNKNSNGCNLGGSFGTGTGNSGDIEIFTGGYSVTSGTAQHFSVDRIYIAAKKATLTSGSATPFVVLGMNTAGRCSGCTVFFTVVATDGTDFQTFTGSFSAAAVNKGGTVTASSSAVTESSNVTTSGTISVTADTNVSTTNVQLRLTSTSTVMTPTSVTVTYTVMNQGTLGFVTPQ